MSNMIITINCSFQKGKTIRKVSNPIEKKYELEKTESIDKETLFDIISRANIKKKNEIAYIRYYDIIDKGWFLVKDDSVIPLQYSQLKLLIKPKEDPKTTSNSKIRLRKRIENLENKINSMITEEKEFDLGQNFLCILFSNPLVYIDQNNSVRDLISIYDFSKNVDELFNQFSQFEKAFQCDFCVCTIDNLLECLRNNFRVVHFFCDSGFYEDKEFYLFFENKKAELVKITYEKFNKLLTENFEEFELNEIKHNVLIIINTPFSEDALNLFKSLGFTSVISVHTNTTNGLMSSGFVKTFYTNHINNSKSVLKSFNDAKIVVEVEKDVRNCCCYHSHTPQCTWKLYHIEQPQEAHFKHLRKGCNCDYPTYNIHKSNCEFAKTSKWKSPSKSGIKQNVCCCKAQSCTGLKHCISEMILGYFKNEDKMNQTELIDFKNGKMSFYSEENKIARRSKRMVGRNLELYKIHQYLTDESECQKDLIITVGEKLTGNCFFVENLITYFNERGIIIEEVKLKKTKEGPDYSSTFLYDFEPSIVYIINLSHESQEVLEKMIKMSEYYIKEHKCKIILMTSTAPKEKEKYNLIEFHRYSELESRLIFINKIIACRTQKECNKLLENRTTQNNNCIMY